jgi:hypothetical protein
MVDRFRAGEFEDAGLAVGCHRRDSDVGDVSGVDEGCVRCRPVSAAAAVDHRRNDPVVKVEEPGRPQHRAVNGWGAARCFARAAR